MEAFAGGRLVVSLDLELHWGVSDLCPVEAVRERLAGARRIVPRLAALFEDYGVRATWAVAGMLLCRGRDEIAQAVPRNRRPRYRNGGLSNYRLLRSIGAGEADDPFHFASSLVDQVRRVDGQEIATHTFSHFYALEPGATSEAFEVDLLAAIDVARRRGLSTRSIVFPRNQYSDASLAICERHGVRAFRGVPPRWMYGSTNLGGESLGRRAARLVEAHIPLGPGNLYTPTQCRGERRIANIAASRFLRPAEGARLLVERRLSLIEAEMRAAARLGRLYHLWWHPHNFGADPDANLAVLRRVLDVYRELSASGMRSLTMAETAEEVFRHEARVAAGARQ